jgi:hypothetical protein
MSATGSIPAAEDPGIPINLPDMDDDLRERALPIRPGDLLRLIGSDPDLTPEERTKLSHLGEIVGGLFHSEFYDRLRELKELYAPIDPDSDYLAIPDCSREPTPEATQRFFDQFAATMIKANYLELDHSVLRQAIAAPNETGLNFVSDFGMFEHLRVFARGFTHINRVARTSRTRYRKRTVVLDAYQRMVVVIKFKESKKLGTMARSDAVYMRLFKDVPHVDMEMHLPEQSSKVRMRWIDRAQIASPLVFGIPALALKLATISFSPYILGGIMAGPISAGVKSFFGFQRAKEKHMASVIRNLYYLTLANNASVLTRLIDSAEEEEYKETMLGYYFLWRASTQGGEALGRDSLDRHVEQFLSDRTGAEINFEVTDSLEKLARLGLAYKRLDGTYQATPIDEALALLDARWDETFRADRHPSRTRQAASMLNKF